MATTIIAHLSSRRDRWRLYVVLPRPVSAWPEADLGSGEVPTVRERSRALNALGYTFTDGAEWQWTETTLWPDDPTARAYLIASIEVREAPE
ncbi:DUF6303 family protein [Streptomyces lateritius]|uniref:DUF6303 family protein n=1 Tax=Streptomyces lateritius TaxID=67313 RepID=UPI00167B3998|nr:DUF6303 family protein [Streptomyces lateritius]GGT62519.1 hypothetical protein GCM10010272_00600 [Streptomyces lateritius]